MNTKPQENHADNNLPVVPGRLANNRSLAEHREEVHDEIFRTPATREFIKEMRIREFNTIPERTPLEITFVEENFHIGMCPFLNKKGEEEYEKRVFAMARIKYNREASHLIMGREYPLALSKNAVLGLVNEINSQGKNFNLLNRTFVVTNKNRKTYKWKEISRN